jgi:hypothetical protein
MGIQTFGVSEENTSNLLFNDVDHILCKRKYLRHIRPLELQRYIRFHWRKKKLLNEVIHDYDTFLFLWRGFRDDAADLEFLKKLGKKIVVVFVGSDVRWRTSYNQEVKRYSIPSFYDRLDPTEESTIKELHNKLRYLRMAEKYADLIYSLPNQSQLALRPYNHFFVPINKNLIPENTGQREIPVVAHAPSRRAVKGTDIVLATLEKLKNEGIKFETKLIENMPYLDALKEYSNSDILIGELFIPSAGKLDREALAGGTIVLSSMRYDYIDNPPSDCPIIDVHPDNLYHELKSIILDYPRRVELAKKGPAFVKKYHDVNSICEDIVDKLSNPTEPKWDFYPEFFRDHFIPENMEYTGLYNRYNQLVSNTDWYKKYVKPGERAGLIF